MDRSIGRLPDPVPRAPDTERRRRVRQQLHTPVYVSFNGTQTGMVVDLSELIDLHEEGFAVRTGEPLEANRAVTLCLDLPETRSFVHGTGEVIWSDAAGRGGIRFSQLSESSRKILKEWLFANLLIGCSNHAARTAQLAHHEEQKLLEPPTVPSSAMPVSDRSENPLEAVRREVHELGEDFDAALQLITERALILTGASGVALAFTDRAIAGSAFVDANQMICRARAGEPAPPLGSPVSLEHGLSGECVRTGSLVLCEDTETDSRVDPEVSRALGIRSLMAAPIFSDFRVVGLLEIFSPHPHAFTEADETVLERLVEMIPKSHREEMPPEIARIQSPSRSESRSPTPVSTSTLIASAPVDSDSLHAVREALWDAKANAREEASPQVVAEVAANKAVHQHPELTLDAPSTSPSRLLYRTLLGLAVAVVALVVGYLIGPIIEKRWNASPSVSAHSTISPFSGQNTARNAQPKSLADLQKSAERGDPDAQWQMAIRYHDGEGVPQDDTEAMKWFERAAEQGHVDAQSHLGAYYWAGRGVPVDLSKAYFWSAIATAQGDEISKARLEGLSSQMTDSQVAAARQQAEAWMRAHTQRATSAPN